MPNSNTNTYLGAAAISALLKTRKKLFFIGIGGVHMSALALAAAQRGFAVSGCDACESERVAELRRAGIAVETGEVPCLPSDAEAAVYTLAVSCDDPIFAAASARGIPLISRADFLGYISADYPRRVAIAGSHGKSTVTAMLTAILNAQALHPTVFCGAAMPPHGSPLLLGKGEVCVMEACEYKDSFLALSPTVGVLLNVEHDHVDYFPDEAAIERSFARFAARVQRGGTIVCNAEDARAMRCAKDADARLFTFGLHRGDCHAEHLRYAGGRGEFSLCLMDKICGEVRLLVPGEHNVKNALAAAACAALLGVHLPTALHALSNFCGAARRMEYRGFFCGARLYDDYAHHPTEIAAGITTARALNPGGRLFVVFQSHTFSRTAALFEPLCEALRAADRVFVTDIYPARERDTLGMSAERLALGIGEHAAFVGGLREIAQALSREVYPGDTVLVMGAGDIDRIFCEFSPKHFTL